MGRFRPPPETTPCVFHAYRLSFGLAKDTNRTATVSSSALTALTWSSAFRSCRVCQSSPQPPLAAVTTPSISRTNQSAEPKANRPTQPTEPTNGTKPNQTKPNQTNRPTDRPTETTKYTNQSNRSVPQVDHFENLQSTNWQTVRWKPPPPRVSPNDPHVGWRTEFRSLEIQLVGGRLGFDSIGRGGVTRGWGVGSREVD